VVKRPWGSCLVALSLLLGIALSLWFWWIAPIRSEIQWSQRVRADYYSLVHNRPADVTPAQWDLLVGWTINLHANCGSGQLGVDANWRDGFAAELEARLQGSVGVVDIDWIWDQYAQNTKYGREYSESYRPTRAPDLNRVEVGIFGLAVE
jgi:hypothetical protein